MAKKTLSVLQQQIAALQKEAAAIETKEKAEVVARIREAIAHYELSEAELFGPRRRGRKPGATATVKAAATSAAPSKARGAKLAGKKIAVKYRDKQGNTWTGRGNRPRWLVAALADGHKVEDFAV